MTYTEYLKSEHWKKTREYVLEYWGGRCALCYSSIDVHVHHRNYLRLGHERITDLIPLCEKCHQTHHITARSGSEPIQATLHRIVENTIMNNE